MAHTRDTPETQTKKLLKRGGDRDKIQQAKANKQKGMEETISISDKVEYTWKQNRSPFFLKNITDQKYDTLFPKINLLSIN